MNFSDLKHSLFLPFIYLLSFTFIFSSIAQAADIQAQLDSNDGSSGFSVQNKNPSEVARVDSSGNLTAYGNVGVGTSTAYTLLYVSPQGMAPSYAGAGDAYIQNNLEVDGTTYLNDVEINGLAVNGLAITGKQNLDSLLVTGPASLATTSGNVGVGTVGPQNLFAVGATSQFQVNPSGAIAAVTGITSTGGYAQSGPNANTLSGTTTFSAAGTSGAFASNVGIGSLHPGQTLDVNGTIRTNSFTMSGENPISGYVMTASDSAGDTTWSSAGGVAGWTTSGVNVYETGGGNVGIGTTLLTSAALSVMNGNVGIGTWAPSAALAVGVNAFMVNSNGAITATTGITTSGAYTQSAGLANTLTGNTAFTNGGTSATFSGNVGIGTTTPAGGLTVVGSNVGIGTWVPAALLDVSTGVGTGPEYGQLSGGLGAGNDLYVQNDMAVDGTAYFYNVEVDGLLTATGLHFSGQQSLDSLIVTGPAYLATTSGNVGVGTEGPQNMFAVGATSQFQINPAGAIAAVTGITTTGGYTQSGPNVNTLSGLTTFASNVGIGSLHPGESLDINGTVRATGLIMSGENAFAGYVLTASDSAGDTTWSSAGGVAGWTTSGVNVYETGGGNVGIGTSLLTTAALAVMNGNVGIGTWVPTGSLEVNGSTENVYVNTNGNVGIGTPNPGYPLEISHVTNGAIRLRNTTANHAYSFDVFTDGKLYLEDTTAAGASRLALDTNGNVGIGTTTPVGGLSVMNGNVGIGTWVPSKALEVESSSSGTTLTSATAAAIGIHNTNSTDNNYADLAFSTLDTSGVSKLGSKISGVFTNHTAGSVSGEMAFLTNNAGTVTEKMRLSSAGNLGIGSTAPGQALDVNGTVRTVGFVMSGENAFAGYVLTASDSAGDTTWSSAGGVAGWTTSGVNVYETGGGNVGIGTSQLTAAALTVMNGNVGIGTWVPSEALSIGSDALTISSIGNVTTIGGYAQSNNTPNTFSGNTAFNAAATSATFAGNVGVGTSTPGGSLTVVGGNVGLGTWKPINSLDINSNAAIGAGYAGIQTAPVNGLIVEGNVGIGTTSAQTGLTVLGNVGIGTLTAANGKMIIMGGNVGIGTFIPPVMFAVGNGVPASATAFDDSYFGHDVEIKGKLYANQVIGGETLAGDIDLGGYYIRSNDLAGNGIVSIHGGMGPDTTDLAVGVNSFVGIGTSTPASRLTVNGGEAIGTSQSYLTTLAPANGLMVQGNVGIGSQAPGQALDVNGTVRTIEMTMSGENPISGYVLTASDSAGDTTWSSAGGVAGWTTSGTNVYETGGGNVGIGTSLLTTAALTVMNGNVGIGTWVPSAALSVMNGNVGIGSASPSYALDIAQASGVDFELSRPGSATGLQINLGASQTSMNNTGSLLISANNNTGSIFVSNPRVAINASSLAGGSTFDVNGNLSVGTDYYQTNAPANGAIIEGNVGIGSTVPGQALDITGTVRAIELTMSGENPIGGYVLTASDSAGDTTWSSAGGVAGWTTSGVNVYETGGGNVGIGTTITNAGAGLTVMNGNVGVGTWAPVAALQVIGGGSPDTLYLTNKTTSAQASVYLNSDTTNWTLGGSGSTNATLTNSFYINQVGQATMRLAINNNGNVGINDNSPQTRLSVVGNGQIGYASGQTGPVNGFLVNGNVGIGSTAPGQKLDIQGTVRAIELTMSGENPISGYVLTASDSAGDTTWSSAGGVAGWTTSGTNVYETGGGNVGIGTSLLTTAALTVMNGNVGIGTWVPSAALSVMNGNVGIGSASPSYALDIAQASGVDFELSRPGSATGLQINLGASQTSMNNTGSLLISANNNTGSIFVSNPRVAINASSLAGGSTFDVNGNLSVGTDYYQTNAPANGAIIEGNVGIGSTVPGQALDITGTVRAIELTMSGENPIGGYVLTASDSAGDTTWSSAGGVAGWTTSGVNVYETGGGNVGIGTTITNAGAGLTVMNGNVGVGTWAPVAALQVIGGGSPDTLYLTNKTTSAQASVYLNSDTTNWTLGGSGSTNATLTNSFYINQVGQATMRLAINNNGNVGINDNSPQTRLSVVGNGQIGYASGQTGPVNGFLVNGNVGIGSTAPGQKLDIQGTVRAIELTMSGENPISGYVLTASDSAGDTTWSSAGGVAGWTTSGTNVYETGGGNVGIGTSLLTTAALTVMNGNVGIGTWVPSAALSVMNGNVGIGSASPSYALDIAQASGVDFELSRPGSATGLQINLGASQTSMNNTGSLLISANNNTGSIFVSNPRVAINASSLAGGSTFDVNGNLSVGTDYYQTNAPANGAIIEGNVGIGSTVPGQALDITGTVRAIELTMSGENPIGGYVLTASDSAGDTTWSSAGGVAGWTTSGVNVYETGGGNVGIGTTITNAGAGLTVMNGNVGVGTWAPVAALQVIGGGSPDTLYLTNKTTSAQASVYLNSDTTNWTLGGSGSTNATLTNSFYINQVGQATMRLAINNNGNVGINDNSPQTRLSVVGNGQIGYASGQTGPVNGFLVNGNVGIGSTAPGQKLDIQGTVRAIELTMSGENPISGYVLTASDSAGDTTWSSAGGVAGWTTSGTNVYETGGGNVGIGTSLLTTAALTVMNGNVGIGTWVPAYALDVLGSIRSSAFSTNGAIPFVNGTNGPLSQDTNLTYSGGVLNSGFGLSFNTGTRQITNTAGQIQIEASAGTSIETALSVNSPSAPNGGVAYFNGNVGIGSTAPGQALDITGTVRAVELTMSGENPIGGYVLTASDSAGDTTWSSAGGVAGWTTSGSNVYETGSGNVGIGTNTPQGALVVTNGNVGIGTWTAAGGNLIINGGGNVGIGSAWPGATLDVQGNIRASGTISGTVSLGGWTNSGSNVFTTVGANNVGIGTATPQGGLVVTNGNVGIGTWSPASTFTINGSMAVTTVNASANYLATSSDNVILVSASGGAVTVTLPAVASVAGREYIIKKTDNSPNPVIIKGNAADNIDGQNTVSTSLQYQSYTIVSDGSSWDII